MILEGVSQNAPDPPVWGMGGKVSTWGKEPVVLWATCVQPFRTANCRVSANQIRSFVMKETCRAASQL